MTTKPASERLSARRPIPLPDPPRKRDMQESLRFELTADMNTLTRHFDAERADSTILVAGKGYLCRQRSDMPSSPYPDLLVAFDVDAAFIADTNGYVIREVGKPPDLVLEVASSTTGQLDYTEKRRIYADLGVVEYWRFDHTGGRYHDVALAGDRLTEAGVYRPVEMRTEADGVTWGYSEALSLSLCWVEWRLRFWDRRQERFLPDPSELARELSETQSELDRERQARLEAEARSARLEEELRRRQVP